MQSKGMLIIISGPSGSGKGTVVKKLVPSDDLALSISLTTRPMRQGEVNGKDYFFCSMEEFLDKRTKNELLEHAVFCDNYYGTPKYYVQEQVELGKSVILEIDVNGALQVKEKFKESVLIFLMPPTMKELSRRLVSRNTENKETIEDRLYRATEEIQLIDKYDYLVINDTVENAVDRIKRIVDAECLKPHRNEYTIKKFKGEI